MTVCWKIIITAFLLELILRLKAKREKKSKGAVRRKRDIKARIISQRLAFLLCLKFEL